MLRLDHQVRGRACPTLLGSAAMCTKGTASRPPTAKGLADIGVQENEICSRGQCHRCADYPTIPSYSAWGPIQNQ